MNLKRWRMRSCFSLAVGGALSFLGASAGQALTYSSGDVVGVFVNAGTELIVDMGKLTSLTNGEVFNFGTPSNFGSTGALGGIFTAFETNAPFSGTTRTLVYTADPTLNPAPPSFDNNLGAYVSKLSPAQSSLDGGSIAAGGWLQNLNGFPTPPTGGVIINDATRLSILATNPSSYTGVLNGSGKNEIAGNMPFSTAVNLTANGQLADIWSGSRTGLTTSKTTLLGTFTVDGNPAPGDGSDVRITFSAVPEPGTMLLLSAGLVGLLWRGTRRKSD